MNNNIFPCIWSDGNAKELASVYGSIFSNLLITHDSPVTVSFQLNEQSFLGLNGGPLFKPNPTISLYTTFETDIEIEKAWSVLSLEGKIIMPLTSYPWSIKYGWVEDRYGVSWQLTVGKLTDVDQQIIPALMFTNDQYGKAEAAIAHYTSIFPESSTAFIARYEEGEQLDKISHAQFLINGYKMVAMDSNMPHASDFTEGMSMVVMCESQEEVDHYWNALTLKGKEGQCGWLKDQFGVSWQIVPSILPDLLKDPARASHITSVFMKMKKLDIEKLVKA